jgi:hypothetical protein
MELGAALHQRQRGGAPFATHEKESDPDSGKITLISRGNMKFIFHNASGALPDALIGLSKRGRA